LQFAHDLFDRHAEEIYHYVLAWTGDQTSAVDLTTTVLRTAVARMDPLADGTDDADLEMRLIALARAAVSKWRERRPGQPASTAVPEDSTALFDVLGELDDDQREILTLSELLQQSPEHVGRLLGCDASAVDARRDEALESLWRAMNDAPPGQPVSTWDRLTVATGLRRAAAGWLGPAGTVLAYLGEQLFGEVPVGVPATAPARSAPARGAAAEAPANGAPDGAAVVPHAAPRSAPKPAAVPAAKAAANGAAGDAAAMPPPTAAGGMGARPNGSAEPPAGATEQPGGRAAVAEREPARQQHAVLDRWTAGLVSLLRGRWAAWGIAATAAAALGVVTALTIGGPVGGSSQCATRLACLPTSTIGQASGNAGEVAPAPTDASGNLLPTTTGGPGMVGPAQGLPGFPVITGGPTSSGANGQVPRTTRRAPGTTAGPPKPTSPGPTSPPTTSPPTTGPPTTIPPTTIPPTTIPPTTSLPPAGP
jgi:DNA-directed RNA polymerase specialized sigma24 family protein